MAAPKTLLCFAAKHAGKKLPHDHLTTSKFWSAVSTSQLEFESTLNSNATWFERKPFQSRKSKVLIRIKVSIKDSRSNCKIVLFVYIDYLFRTLPQPANRNGRLKFVCRQVVVRELFTSMLCSKTQQSLWSRHLYSVIALFINLRPWNKTLFSRVDGSYL